MSMPMRPLKPREQKLVEEYLVDLRGKEAAMRAGYRPSTAHCSFKMLRRPHVAAAIAEAMAARARRTQITADRVLREYARIAFADIRSFTTKETGGERSLKAVADLSDDEAAAVSEIAPVGKGNGVKLKLHDKKHALDAIARHLGLFTKGQEPAESPSAAAERARELIRGKLAELARRRNQG